MDNNLPPLPVSPGQLLMAELNKRGLLIEAFAFSCAFKLMELINILAGNKAIDEESAALIAVALDMDPQIWLDHQNKYDADLHALLQKYYSDYTEEMQNNSYRSGFRDGFDFGLKAKDNLIPLWQKPVN